MARGCDSREPCTRGGAQLLNPGLKRRRRPSPLLSQNQSVVTRMAVPSGKLRHMPRRFLLRRASEAAEPEQVTLRPAREDIAGQRHPGRSVTLRAPQRPEGGFPEAAEQWFAAWAWTPVP